MVAVPDAAIVKDFSLEQNYPNPFNPVSTINYTIYSPGRVNLTVYDILGKKIATLVDEFQSANTYSYNINGADYSSGLYFYQLTVGSVFETKKMIL